MSENTDSERPVIPRRVVQMLPFIIFALVALTVGLLATRTVESPYATPFFRLLFSDSKHMKVWLSTAAFLLVLTQPLTASRIYGLLHFPPRGNFYNVVHRWTGRTAIILTLPVAYHCIFKLGFGTENTRVFIHSLLGSSVYGVFLAKVFIVRARGFPGWALPIAGDVLLLTLLGLWLTSALWFFINFGMGI